MTDSSPPNWERSVLERIALKALDEQRRSRQWGALFKILWLIFFFLILAAWMGWIGRPDKELGSASSTGRHTALVNLEGVIAPEGKASADRIIKALDRAFKDPTTQGVVLRINSPGGSPVQAGYINDEMRRLRAKYPKTPLYVVVQDLCASGGYYVAVAADRIYVDKASLVGSIGVIINGFGFTGTMEKLGIERRAYTAGENKDFLDPFAPENPAQKEYAQKMIGEIHQQFIDVVKKGRGARLKETPDMFSGLVWTGEKSVELGLADGFGSAQSVARDVIKAEKLVDYTPEDNVFETISRRLGTRFGAALGQAAAESAVAGMGGLR
ncbi:MAG TPA: S49 family peptidase [Usitatibacter sp.]|jgi:protease-4|nr:S49 family peptidase [Usitatibacter sp.]